MRLIALNGVPRARAYARAVVVFASICAASLSPTPALGATGPSAQTSQVQSSNGKPSGGRHATRPHPFPIPASARVQGTTPTTSTPIPSPPATAAGGAAAAPSASSPGGIPTPGAGNATTQPGAAPAARVRPRGESSKLSTWALVGAGIAGLLILLSAMWGVVRWLAIEPRWTRSLAYSLEEAGFRTSLTWAELLDWARLGR